jgi:hypothetical protein
VSGPKSPQWRKSAEQLEPIVLELTRAALRAALKHAWPAEQRHVRKHVHTSISAAGIRAALRQLEDLGEVETVYWTGTVGWLPAKSLTKGAAMRTITLPALHNKQVPIGAYVQAVKTAIAHPNTEFKHGLTTWWPTTGREIREQFRRGMHDRINQAIPYTTRGT